jgi:hypothetical protein
MIKIKIVLIIIIMADNTEPVEFDDPYYIFKCPHCKIYIIVLKTEINCRIFRCGVYISNNNQINPHTPKNECDRLKDKKLIHGCGKPFIFKEKYVEICDYI